MITYKGFNDDLTCIGFKYEVGQEYEMDDNIKVCGRGFHACESPLEVFEYYNMITSRFCKVEQSGMIDRGKDSTKVCSSKIKIISELKLTDMIIMGIEWLIEKTKSSVDNIKSHNDNSRPCVHIASSIDCVQIGSSGSSAYISSNGAHTQIGSSGYNVQISSSGNYSQIGSSGEYAGISSSGTNNNIGSSGYFAKITSSGDFTQIASSGDCAQIGSSGYGVKIVSSGNSAKISSSGKFAQIDSTGFNSVICCVGHGSVVKAKVGSWITLSEWEYNESVSKKPLCVKTEYVDGERIKADTWYRLVNGEFVEIF